VFSYHFQNPRKLADTGTTSPHQQEQVDLLLVQLGGMTRLYPKRHCGYPRHQHLRVQIRLQDVNSKKISSGSWIVFSGTHEIYSSAIFSTYELFVRISENVPQ